ncbi:hypothetical protein C9374_010232 [Naegleria lovaniensis]|uniref:Protein kinase domain-containing protein n=1 Tax=Naegleria lovaniensis TaxID=51637 RepID=A0AA88GGR2_NAELO|nr:uncharacterized protein C9374_010232 [Naegleria lovaniensis]KAG2374858.1 hypothetical protein C9374_010232 [Naegleria lovaniensis]
MWAREVCAHTLCNGQYMVLKRLASGSEGTVFQCVPVMMSSGGGGGGVSYPMMMMMDSLSRGSNNNSSRGSSSNNNSRGSSSRGSNNSTMNHSRPTSMNMMIYGNGGHVAIKKLSETFDRIKLEEFKWHLEQVRQLSHPNIIPYLDTFIEQKGEDEYSCCIVMPFYKSTLHQRILDCKKLNLKYLPNWTSVALQISLGLQKIHMNHLIFRDLKTENILIELPSLNSTATTATTTTATTTTTSNTTNTTNTTTSDKSSHPIRYSMSGHLSHEWSLSSLSSMSSNHFNTMRVVISDFGLLKPVHDIEMSYMKGTPITISPEAVTGEFKVDQSSDIFSLGCVLFELLTLDIQIEMKVNRSNDIMTSHPREYSQRVVVASSRHPNSSSSNSGSNSSGNNNNSSVHSHAATNSSSNTTSHLVQHTKFLINEAIKTNEAETHYIIYSKLKKNKIHDFIIRLVLSMLRLHPNARPSIDVVVDILNVFNSNQHYHSNAIQECVRRYDKLLVKLPKHRRGGNTYFMSSFSIMKRQEMIRDYLKKYHEQYMNDSRGTRFKICHSDDHHTNHDNQLITVMDLVEPHLGEIYHVRKYSNLKEFTEMSSKFSLFQHKYLVQKLEEFMGTIGCRNISNNNTHYYCIVTKYYPISLRTLLLNHTSSTLNIYLFSEYELLNLIFKIMQAVQYLHDRQYIHTQLTLDHVLLVHENHSWNSTIMNSTTRCNTTTIGSTDFITSENSMMMDIVLSGIEYIENIENLESTTTTTTTTNNNHKKTTRMAKKRNHSTSFHHRQQQVHIKMPSIRFY